MKHQAHRFFCRAAAGACYSGDADSHCRLRAIADAFGQRGGEPEEMAYMAVFLASDDSRYVNGTAMVVDGGLSAGA